MNDVVPPVAEPTAPANSRDHLCINWPCALPTGHDGPCNSVDDNYGEGYTGDRESRWCECNATHSDGTEEADSGICSACGGML